MISCFVGTIFSHNKLFAEQCPPSRNEAKSSEDGMRQPVWKGSLQSSHPTDSLNASVNIQLHIPGDP